MAVVQYPHQVRIYSLHSIESIENAGRLMRGEVPGGLPTGSVEAYARRLAKRGLQLWEISMLTATRVPLRRCTLRLAASALVALAALTSQKLKAEADYFSLSPCRVYDTRTPVHDPLHGGLDPRRDIQVSGLCGVPAEASAVAVNLTGIDASRTGALIVYDADLASAPTPYSTLSLSAGRTRANNAIVGLSVDGKIAAELSPVFATSDDTADLAVDVLGYFVEDIPPTAVDDTATVVQNTTENPIDVLANDTDPDGGTKLVTAVDTTDAAGSVAITGGGTGVAYTPPPDYCTTPPGGFADTFAYTITGGSTAHVSVSILCAMIRIRKFTNGQDANSPPGPEVAQGDIVAWTYQILNVGGIALSNIQVTDDQNVAVSCPKTSLQPAESMNCTGHGVAQACQYTNIGSVTAKTPTGETVSAMDPSHYFGTPCP
jgi:hypothetical protein